jgi:hypothetical protein
MAAGTGLQTAMVPAASSGEGMDERESERGESSICVIRLMEGRGDLEAERA